MTPQEIAHKRYEAFRGQIQHEDILFNQRITWLLALQAFLLFPYVSLHSVDVSKLSDTAPETIESLRTIVAIIGLLSCVFALCSCFAAYIRIEKLARDFLRRSQYDVKTHLPDIRSPRLIHWYGAMAPYGFVLLFALVWGHLLSGHQPLGSGIVYKASVASILLVIAGFVIRRDALSQLSADENELAKKTILELFIDNPKVGNEIVEEWKNLHTTSNSTD